MSKSTVWCQTYDNVVRLAAWLADQYIFDSPQNVVRFFEKPWKWTREWSLCEAYDATKDDALREKLIEAINDDDLTATDVVAEHNDTKERNQRCSF